MSNSSQPSTIRDLWPWLAGYVVLVVAIVAGMLIARERVLSQTDRAAEQAGWDQWRADAAGQSGAAGPVLRTMPKSAEPPIRILMRDHFAAVVIGAIAPVTALYVFVAWVIRGVLRQSRQR